MTSYKVPYKKITSGGNYVSQIGIPTAQYGVSAMQLEQITPEHIGESMRVPMNGNMMRVVGRATIEDDYVGIDPSQMFEPYDPILRNLAGLTPRMYNLGGTRVAARYDRLRGLNGRSNVRV